VFKWFNSLFRDSDKLPGTDNDDLVVLNSIDTGSLPDDLKHMHSKALDYDPLAIFRLGLSYYNGRGVDQDYDLAYKIMMLLVNEDADAEYYMGEICRQGIKGKPDYAQACCHYAAAMHFGMPQAKVRLKEVANITGDEFWLTWGDEK
jgi:TPR repeat protein